MTRKPTRKATSKAKTRTATRAKTTTKRKTTNVRTKALPDPSDIQEPDAPIPDALRADAPDSAPTEDATATPAPMLRKTALIERVVEATGLKRKDVKPVVEATLKELGAALGQGEDLHVMPLGKVKINRRKTVGDDEVMVLKLRRSLPVSEAGDPLAETGEDR